MIPNNYGGHQSPYGPPNQQPLSPYQQHHLTHPGNQQPYQHHQPPQHIHQLPSIQQQNSPVGDNGERFYQNLSIYRNQEVHNGYPPHHNGVGRGKLPSPQDERYCFFKIYEYRKEQRLNIIYSSPIKNISISYHN